MPHMRFKHARILLVDHEVSNVRVLERLLSQAGFDRLESTTDPREAARRYIENRPDLILLDLHMPNLDGLAVLDELRGVAENSYLPILILTADLTPEARQGALARRAPDFVGKPFEADEVLIRIRTLLERRYRFLRVQCRNQVLEAKARPRKLEAAQMQIEVILQFAREAEHRLRALAEEIGGSRASGDHRFAHHSTAGCPERSRGRSARAGPYGIPVRSL